jgi:hypothetical protein
MAPLPTMLSSAPPPIIRGMIFQSYLLPANWQLCTRRLPPTHLHFTLCVAVPMPTAFWIVLLLSTAQQENLTRAQRLLLFVHQRMPHLNLDHVQRLARSGYFCEALHCIASCDKILCSACFTGKASQRSARKDGTPLKAEHLKLGDCISADELQSNTPGRIPVWKGKPSNLSYGAASLFIDHASNKVHLGLHHSTGSAEAVELSIALRR